MPGVIVPRKTVGELRKLLEDDEAEIAVSVSETKIRFATPEITLTSKVIDGTFPDYSRVIPQGNTRRMEVDASDFAKAVDRVATVSSERSRAVKMQLDEDRLILSVNAPDAAPPKRNWPWPMATTSWRSGSTRNTCWKSPARWIARTRCSCSTLGGTDADAGRRRPERDLRRDADARVTGPELPAIPTGKSRLFPHVFLQENASMTPYVAHLSLSHFRSHRRTRLDLDGRPVALFGPNGAGKTNLMEAVSLLSPGRGLRRATAEEIIRRPEAIGWKVRATSPVPAWTTRSSWPPNPMPPAAPASTANPPRRWRWRVSSASSGWSRAGQALDRGRGRAAAVSRPHDDELPARPCRGCADL
jgi:hypothetical protein